MCDLPSFRVHLKSLAQRSCHLSPSVAMAPSLGPSAERAASIPVVFEPTGWKGTGKNGMPKTRGDLHRFGPKNSRDTGEIQLGAMSYFSARFEGSGTWDWAA